jgi:hypothetical protein
VVQGHPKLIELADGLAVDLVQLEQRVDEADQAWLAAGTRLAAFFERGESTATEQGYLRVLNDWTRATVEALPEASAALFQFLCALEEADRLAGVVESNWADLWRRLDRTDDPPDLGSALASLEAHGLIAVETGQDQPTVYRLHPGVTEASRATAGPNFQTAVDTQLAAY